MSNEIPMRLYREAAERLWALEVGVGGANGDAVKISDALTELERVRAELAAVKAERDALREGRKRIEALLGANGCDCDCDHDFWTHDDDCDPCFPCRVDAAISPAPAPVPARVVLPEFDDDVQTILGRPNFACVRAAALLRLDGKDIPHKAENEQAAVLYWLLTLHAQHGAGWAEKAEEEARRIRDQAKAALERGGGE